MAIVVIGTLFCKVKKEKKVILIYSHILGYNYSIMVHPYEDIIHNSLFTKTAQILTSLIGSVSMPYV